MVEIVGSSKEQVTPILYIHYNYKARNKEHIILSRNLQEYLIWQNFHSELKFVQLISTLQEHT